MHRIFSTGRKIFISRPINHFPLDETASSTLLLAGGHLVVFASGKDRIGTGPAGEHHTNFSLNRNGEFLALVQPDGQNVISGFAPSFPAQLADISYGLSADTTVTGYFRQPTPGTFRARCG